MAESSSTYVEEDGGPNGDGPQGELRTGRGRYREIADLLERIAGMLRQGDD